MDEFDIEIIDDTPEEDRGRTPVDPEVVKNLLIDDDDLDSYSKEAKEKVIKMKRVYHDERRARESAEREKTAATEFAKKLYEENKAMRERISRGEEGFKEAAIAANSVTLESAEKEYRQAYEAGDADALLEANKKMLQAQLNLEKAKNFRPTPLQKDEVEVKSPQVSQPPPIDNKLKSWLAKNTWYNVDHEMTGMAQGVHQKLYEQGADIGSDEYYATIDKVLRNRFPEKFEDSADTPRKTTKSKTVVASAGRATAPTKVRLTQSQIAIAGRLKLTPEQYAKELMALDN